MQHVEITIAREEKFHDQNIKQEPDIDQSKPPLPSTGRSKDSYRTYENDKRKDKKKSSSRISKKCSCKNCDSSKESSDDFNTDHQSKGPVE